VRLSTYLTIGFVLGFGICTYATLMLLTAALGWPTFALTTLILGTTIPPMITVIGGWILFLILGSLFADPDEGARSRVEGVVGALTLPWVGLLALGIVCYLFASYGTPPSWFVLLPLFITTVWIYGPWTNQMTGATATRIRATWVRYGGLLSLATLGYVLVCHWTPAKVDSDILGSAWGKALIGILPSGKYVSLVAIGFLLFFLGFLRRFRPLRGVGFLLLIVFTPLYVWDKHPKAEDIREASKQAHDYVNTVRKGSAQASLERTQKELDEVLETAIATKETADKMNWTISSGSTVPNGYVPAPPPSVKRLDAKWVPEGLVPVTFTDTDAANYSISSASVNPATVTVVVHSTRQNQNFTLSWARESLTANLRYDDGRTNTFPIHWDNQRDLLVGGEVNGYQFFIAWE